MSLTFILILPLVLRKFSEADSALWLLFSNIIALQMFLLLGLGPTFVRLIAYTLGGASIDEIKRISGQTSGNRDRPINFTSLGEICKFMRLVNLIIAIFSMILLVTLGSLGVENLINISSNPNNSWIAWFIITVSAPFALYSNQYNSYLQGTNNIALAERWNTIISLAAVITNFAVLIMNGDLLCLVLSNQAWAVIKCINAKRLSTHVLNGHYKSLTGWKINKDLWNVIWPIACRSGIGHFMSGGILQASGIFYAQIQDAELIATYLLALKLILAVRQVSLAPYYTKIPRMAKLYAEGNRTNIVTVAKRGMFLSYWTFVTGIVTLGVGGDLFLKIANSKVIFPDPLLWGLFGLAFFTERYGAMHIQLYTMTNHVIWHISNGISGIILLIIMYFIVPSQGIYAYPLAVLLSNLLFFMWYSAMHSYKAFQLKFIDIDAKTFAPPLLVLISFSIGCIYYN